MASTGIRLHRARLPVASWSERYSTSPSFLNENKRMVFAADRRNDLADRLDVGWNDYPIGLCHWHGNTRSDAEIYYERGAVAFVDDCFGARDISSSPGSWT